jgi:hypothetical protein
MGALRLLNRYTYRLKAYALYVYSCHSTLLETLALPSRTKCSDQAKHCLAVGCASVQTYLDPGAVGIWIRMRALTWRGQYLRAVGSSEWKEPVAALHG